MKLYGYFRSSAAYRVRIALNLKGLEFEQNSIHLRRKEHQAEGYLALNPQALVPTLIDGDAVLTQSLAIVEYLDETHPEPALLPADAVGRARVRALAQIVASDIHPLNNLRVLNYLTEDLGLSEVDKTRWYRHWIAKGFSSLEAMLANNPDTGMFCHGEKPGLADICLVPQVYNAQRFDCDLSPYPTVTSINDACLSLPAFGNAAPESQPDFE